MIQFDEHIFQKGWNHQLDWLGKFLVGKVFLRSVSIGWVEFSGENILQTANRVGILDKSSRINFLDPMM